MNTRWIAIVAGVAIASGGLGFVAGRRSAPAPLPEGVRAAPESEFTATVVRVGDGDTIDVAPTDPPAPNEKIRLLGIDAPALGEKWCTESTNALRTLVQGKSIRVEFEREGEGRRDKSERVLGYVVLDGQNVNVEMVRQGWARYSDKHGGTRFAAELRSAEDESRSGKRGMWK
ncbi:Thermonuclease [Phycisphaerales bacterium]|nr:Thermonuclease [Phycisphaerales bacterium]